MSGTNTQWHRSSEGTEIAGQRGRGPSRRQGAELSSGEPKEEPQRTGILTGSPHANKSVSSVQFSRDPIDCSMPGFPVHPQLLEFTQSHVH